MSEAVVSKKKLSTVELVYIAVCAALMAVCSWISIPAPAPLAPFTLQTFAVFLILLLLGGRRGFFTVLTYILLGAVGLPVFAQFMGGVGVLFGTTGGYIIGFLFTAASAPGSTGKTRSRSGCWSAMPSARRGSWRSTRGRRARWDLAPR